VGEFADRADLVDHVVDEFLGRAADLAPAETL
jgi:hypothetical protein